MNKSKNQNLKGFRLLALLMCLIAIVPQLGATARVYVRCNEVSASSSYLYVWGSAEAMGGWRGTAISSLSGGSETLNGYTYYYVDINQTTINLILNNTDGQTSDISIPNSGTHYITYNGGNSYSGPNTVPDGTMYVVGANSDIFPNSWGVGDETMMSYNNGTYSWTSGQVHLTENTNYEYKVRDYSGNNWYPSGNNATFNVSQSGTYTITITLNNGVVSYSTTLIQPDVSTVYITGDNVLGGFTFSPSIEMTHQGNGIYTYSTTLTDNATIQFVFADGQGSDWNNFNSNYRIGPANGDQAYTLNSGYIATQRSTNGAYNVTAAAGNITFHLDLNNMQFQVVGIVPAVNYYVLGNDGALFGDVWTQSAAGLMTLDPQTGIYTWTVSNVSLTRGGDYKFKVNGDDGSWYPSDDIQLDVERNGTYNLTVTFDGANVTPILTLVEAESMGTYYIEGSGLGLTWSYDPEQAMTFDSSTGWYSYTANVEKIDTYNFVFANGKGSSWEDFNNNYRIGPQSGGQTVELDGQWVTTQFAGGDNGAYSILLGEGAVTIYFDPAKMQFKVLGQVPTYDYTFYVLPTNTSNTPHLYLWDEDDNKLNGDWPGNEMTDTETLADGNTWNTWSGTLLVNLVNAIVNGGSNADQTQNITNLDPNTYYIRWDAANQSYTISTIPPTEVGTPLYLHGTYYYDKVQHNYSSSDATLMKYDSNNEVYYLNNVTLNDQNTFCFSTGIGEEWTDVGTRYGNGGPDYYELADGTNYLAVTSDKINTELPLGVWDKTLGEYRMTTSGVYNMIVSIEEGYVKLIRTDKKSLTPMNVYLEQTPNVEIDNIQDAGVLYNNAMFDNGYWPLSAYDRVRGGSDYWSTSNQYSVTHLADTVTPDGKTWWHWEVTASICELFFTRTNKAPYQSTTFDRKAGILWVTWDENVIDGDTITSMTDHSREYFEAAATELPANATVVEGHYYVYFINTVGWETVYCNAWNVNGASPYTDSYGRNMEQWPGQACECVGIDPVTGYEVWRYDFGTISETTPPTGLLFNDGNTYAETQAKEQTGDFVFQNGAVYDYLGQFDGAYTLNNLIRNATKEVRYTISNDLLGVYYDRDAKTEITYTNASGTRVSEVITGALYAKDLNLYGEKSVQHDLSTTDYVYDICASTHTAGESQIMDKKTDYDQSNWVKLVVSPLYDGGGNLPVDKNERPDLEEYVDHIIPGGKMIVYMEDRINPTAHILKIEKGAAQVYEPNVYVSAHFNDSVVFAYTHNEWQPKKPDGTSYEGVYRTVPKYVRDEQGNIIGITREVDKSKRYKMFYVAPKPQEVAYLTWIVYDNPNNFVNGIRPYGEYNSGEYQPETHAAYVLPKDPGAFYAPMNWHRGVAFAGDSLNYLSEEGYGVEYGPYSNGYMQYGAVKVNWSLFGDSIGNQAHVVMDGGQAIPWWQIFQPGQAYKIKAIIRYAHDSEGNTLYLPGNGDIIDEKDPAFDERTHVLNAPRRDNGQGGYANMYFTPYDDLEQSKFIIFPIEAHRSESNGDSMGNVTTIQEVTANRTVVSTRYYNLMGVGSDKPFDGINIVVTTFSDGSRTSTKVLR